MNKMKPRASDMQLKESALALICAHRCLRTSALAEILDVAPRKANLIASWLCEDGSVVACTISRPGYPDEQELRPTGSSPCGRQLVQIEKQRAKGRRTQAARASGKAGRSA